MSAEKKRALYISASDLLTYAANAHGAHGQWPERITRLVAEVFRLRAKLRYLTREHVTRSAPVDVEACARRAAEAIATEEHGSDWGRLDGMPDRVAEMEAIIARCFGKAGT